MIINKDGKIFGKISIVDIFIVLLVIGVCYGVYYKIKSPVASIAGGTNQIQYRVLISDVRKFTLDYYEEGLKVFDTKTGTYIGKISYIEWEPFKDVLEKNDGTVVYTEKPTKIRIKLTIDAEGIETDQAYLVGGTYDLKIGAGIYLTTKYVDVIGTVDYVETLE